MKILNHGDVVKALHGRELAVLGAVQSAYVLHSEGASAVPFSSFLRPPGEGGNRIIALPAYLGGREPVIGIKWISSFPGNVERGLQRASSLIILNDLETGYPVALLEASRISAMRTAASAAIASHFLHGTTPVHTAGLIGCGTINEQVVTFLPLVHPEIRQVVLYDALPAHAEAFAARMRAQHPRISFVVGDLEQVLLRSQSVSIATTDSSYWLDLTRYPGRPDGQVILHLSLRDLSTSSVLGAFNVVDDVDHALREQTSLHRAEQEVGHRAFVQATIGELAAQRTAFRPGNGPTVFSPFGLGVLDLAVCAEVVTSADREGIGTWIDGFDPGRHLTSESADDVRPEVRRG